MADEAHATYRVAVASSDGETVNQHYGRAEKFFIYVVDDDEGYDVCEERDVSPVCMGGSHVKSAMDESVRRFADCRYVVASRIGAGAAQALTAAAVRAVQGLDTGVEVTEYAARREQDVLYAYAYGSCIRRIGKAQYR